LQDELFIKKHGVASELTRSAFTLIVVQVVLLNDFICFYFCFVHGRQLLHWRSCTVGEPSVCLLIGPRA